MWKREFWKQAVERVFKTIAQVLGIGITATGLGLIEIDLATWKALALAAVAAGAVSLLTSIGSLAVGPSGSASMVRVLDAAQLKLAETARGLAQAARKAPTPAPVDQAAYKTEVALAEVGQLKP